MKISKTSLLYGLLFMTTAIYASEASIPNNEVTKVAESVEFVLSPEVIAVVSEVRNLVHQDTENCALRALLAAKMSEKMNCQKEKDCFELASQVYALAAFANKQERDNLFANFEDKHPECAQVTKALFYSKKL